mmetsp:Transcript_2030/g.4184  ORF Transcript_2030/g.4184 Transcript_2030/m.4184 type:complete len:335 (-) Transcript_2030:29-1033(-)
MEVYSQRAVFFDRLVDLIPAKHYLVPEEGPIAMRFLEKTKREAIREEFKRKHKDNKRAKLDPDQAGGTVEALKKQEMERKQALAGDEGAPVHHQNGFPDKDDLRQRLKKKLEEMRMQRKAEENSEKVRSAKEWKDGALQVGRKKAAVQQKQARQKISKVDRLAKNSKKGSDKVVEKKQQGANTPKKATGSEFSFGKLDFGQEDGLKKKNKLSKQEILEKVEKDKEKVLSKEEEKKRAWKAALARAHGEKVLDDPKLLKKSIKKDEKLREKKSQAWAERTEKVKEKQSQRQQKRRDNIQARIDSKKAAKKERREKKLLRAGFEGRKKEFIGAKKK